MNNIQKRFLLFIFGCIGTRLFFVYLAKTINIQYLPLLGYLALLPAIGFMYIFFTGARNTGAEVFGDKIWWNHLRPIHALLYFLFAYNAINKVEKAWIYLFVDVILGLTSFIIHHYLAGSFKEL
jgi:hypothetical protein